MVADTGPLLPKPSSLTAVHPPPDHSHNHSLLDNGIASSNIDDDVEQESEFHYLRTASVAHVALVAFFVVSGGPIGIEPLVQSGGPLWAMIALLLFPWVWAFPQIMLTAEMSTMFDSNGGYIIWVQHAFGDFAGFMNAYCSIFTNVFDEAVYPAMVIDYLTTAMPDMSLTVQWGVRIATVLLVVACNLGNADLVGRASMLFSILVLLPFLVMFFWVLVEGDMDASAWVKERPGGTVNFSVWLNVIFWNLSGWDSMGNLAGEVQNPKRTYPLAMALACLLCVACYMLPIFAAVSVSSDYEKFEDGYFVEAADLIGGLLLKNWVLVAAIVSAVGIFNATMSAHVRALYRTARFQYAPSIFARTAKNGAPIVAIAFHASLALGLSLLDFEQLLQLDNLLFGVSLILKKCAFVSMKFREPERHRPYAVPGGKWGAVAITIPAIVVILAIMFLASFRTWLICGSLIIGFALLYVLWHRNLLVHLSKTWKPLQDGLQPEEIFI